MSDERESILRIDVTNIKTSKELHLLLKDQLNFPDFYGGNWNAFWEGGVYPFHYDVKVSTDKESYIFTCMDKTCSGIKIEGSTYSRFTV